MSKTTTTAAAPDTPKHGGLHWIIYAALGFVLLIAVNLVRERVFGPYVDPDAPMSGPSAGSVLAQYRDDYSKAQQALGGQRIMIESALVERVDGHDVVLSDGLSSAERIGASFSWLSSMDGVTAGQMITLICTIDGTSPDRRTVYASGCTKGGAR